MPVPWTTIDDYLDSVAPERRPVLVRIRAMIRALLPGADECISYGMPAFRLHGKVVIGFAAAARHNALYPHSGTVVAACGTALRGYGGTKSAVHLPVDAPPPEAVLRALIDARLAEISAGATRRHSGRSGRS